MLKPLSPERIKELRNIDTRNIGWGWSQILNEVLDAEEFWRTTVAENGAISGSESWPLFCHFCDADDDEDSTHLRPPDNTARFWHNDRESYRHELDCPYVIANKLERRD